MKELRSKGLDINQDETKNMLGSRRETKDNAEVKVIHLLKVNNFKYLEVLVNGKKDQII